MTRPSKDIMLFSLLACCWGLQAAILVQQWLMHWPAPLLLSSSLLPDSLGRMAPKWDLLIYATVILMTVGSSKLLLRFYKRPLSYRYLIIEGVLTF